jgi:hypothetical protein
MSQPVPTLIFWLSLLVLSCWFGSLLWPNQRAYTPQIVAGPNLAIQKNGRYTGVPITVITGDSTLLKSASVLGGAKCTKKP